MTRRIAGSSQAKPTRTPNFLLIGHLSTKSSVYSPVSMSRMSQDLVYNHMKSHYQRIASAKASVDTSPPKSMKLTIKEKDRKRKQALLASSEQGFSSTSISRQTDSDKASNSPREQEISNNYILNHTIVNDNEEISRGQRWWNDERPSSSESFRRQEKFSQNFKHSHQPSLERCNTDVEDFRPNDDSIGRNIHIDHNYERYQRTRLVTDMDKHRSTSPRNWDEWRDLRNEMVENGLEDNDLKTSDKVYTSTPRFKTQDDFGMNPNLTLTFSYKSSTRRKPITKKSAGEIIWTEEQKYLQFISDVTSDILARGICSNRVINRVFESHIEKRKDDLDEENMREMINQLKEDLEVSDG